MYTSIFINNIFLLFWNNNDNNYDNDNRHDNGNKYDNDNTYDNGNKYDNNNKSDNDNKYSYTSYKNNDVIMIMIIRRNMLSIDQTLSSIVNVK